VTRLSLPHLKAALGSPRATRFALDAALVCVLVWGSHAVYRGSHGHIQNCDSVYSLVVAEKMLAERTADLRGCVPADPAARQAMQGYAPGHDLPYHFVRRGEAVYYGYPLGSSVLSLPFVALYDRRGGLPLLHADGRPNLAAEGSLQLRVAARVSAATVGLFYLLARFFCPPLASFLIAAGFALGSPVWSTLSRALWSHTWMVFWLSVSVVLLVARRRAEKPTWGTDLLFGTALGTALFWVLAVRAHGVFSAAAVGVYLLLHHRRTLLVTVAAGGAWSAALVAISLSYFGTPTPPSVYDAGAIDGHDVLNRFAWLMVSPSRGLLVYCPYLAAVGAILAGCRKHLTDAGLLLPAGLAVAAHAALFACYSGWHGGSSYGPRYFSDVLPWFVLATALAARGLLNASAAGWSIRVPVAVLAVCFAWGVFVHARGATSVPAWIWNARSLAVGQEASVKEWRHPQFLAGLTFEVKLDGSVVEK
jgi:hypothetical protein